LVSKNSATKNILAQNASHQKVVMALMPALYAATNRAAKLGVKEVVLGMPHRGRLNVLTAFMGKPYVAMLSEFSAETLQHQIISTHRVT
jgi:2-oxoglutarate dehydrogenase complex dehydrogenase (E1) component-like enzyme